ncbi:MAG: cyclodeaminase/cyclohydrolase family protein, partial [Firmicutes bacterium]|nr:cyclodeaminase/cyclohydrolase family protein [Bacillota bacterium]
MSTELFKDRSIEEFADLLASRASVPGGGGASALCGALG